MPLIIRVFKGGLPDQYDSAAGDGGVRGRRAGEETPTGWRGFLWRHKKAIAAAGAAFLVAMVWLLSPFWRVTAQFGSNPAVQPSRLWERPATLAEGAPFSGARLSRYLDDRGYQLIEHQEPLLPGEYRRREDGRTTHFALRQRRFPTVDGFAGGKYLDVAIRGSRVRELERNGEAADEVLLEPALLASYYGETRSERRPIVLDDLPQHVIDAVIAGEDSRFWKHSGISPIGILRALIVDLREQNMRQGGSTLTQQLVKNIYLNHERTASRKAREAILAVMVDLRYEKEEILEAYLNEIYLGRSGRVNLHGFGAASLAYFGKPAEQLTLVEAATIAGVIPSPNGWSPLRNPEQAQAARDRVLRLMAEGDMIDQAALEHALSVPLRTAPQPLGVLRARYAADAAAVELEQRFQLAEVADRGLQILSTLSLEDQLAAEEAVIWGVSSLEEGWEKGHESGHRLQAALLSIDPRDGSVLAYVGGRNYVESQFDRVRSARRQAGSAFKPLVYAAAFAEGVVSPSSVLDDSELEVVQAGRVWRPQNFDREFRGKVTVRQAVEKSYNVPTVDVALNTDLRKVVAWARELGIESPLEPLPSIALGSFEVTPRELLAAYATFANSGTRPSIHLVEGVLSHDGQPLEGSAIAAPRPALDPGVSYLVTSVLEGVMDRGTGAGARRAGLADPVAGKTGTSNDARDSWFLGYSKERASVVWVGYDEGDKTKLGGSRAALPIWTRFTAARRPPGGYAPVDPPDGVVSARVDPTTGELATPRCFLAVTDVFLEDRVPERYCREHGGERYEWRERRRPWWKRMFRDGDSRSSRGDRHSSTRGRNGNGR